MLLRNYLIKFGGVIFQSMLFDIFYFNFNDTLTECNLDNVSDFHIVRSFGIFSIHLYMLGITSIVGNGSSFDNSGDF